MSVLLQPTVSLRPATVKLPSHHVFLISTRQIEPLFLPFAFQAVAAHLVNIASINPDQIFEMLDLNADPTLQVEVSI